MAKKTSKTRKKRKLIPVKPKTDEQVSIEENLSNPDFEIASLFPGNFKSYKFDYDDKKMEMPDLAPITIIVGPNSAGKSSYIQFLVMMAQSISHNKLGLQYLNSRSPYVDLGFYTSFINDQNNKEELIPVGVIKKKYKNRIDYFQYNLRYKDYKDRASLVLCSCFDFDQTTYENRHKQNIYKDANKRAISFLYREDERDCVISGEIPSDLIDYIFQRLERDTKNLVLEETDKNLGEISKNDLDFYLHHIAIGIDPKTGLPERVNRGNYATTGKNDKNKLVDLLTYKISGYRNILINSTIDAYIKRVVSPLGEIFSRVDYIGPSRVAPRRSERNMGRSDTVGTSGEYTSNILLYDKIAIQNINSVLKTLEVPYEIDVAEYGIKSIDEMYSLTLTKTNSKKKTTVSSVDVGFGIFQFLPFILTGIKNKKSLIPVEQPEIHLHPKLIANLGDFFIETSNIEIKESDRVFKFNSKHLDPNNKYIFGNQWIIETHSELLIRRILRRIREGKISNDDVSILYVNPPDNKNDKSIIKRLKIDKKGNFIDRWPEGFFSEALDEM